MKSVIVAVIFTLAFWGSTNARPESNPHDHEAVADKYMHPYQSRKVVSRSVKSNMDEETLEFWYKNAQEAVWQRIAEKRIEGVAKNVILFLGDGMSIPTIAATRVLLGGEEAQLAFEKFPYVALSKTYCVDHQVADSACSATAYLGGVKANMGTIGVTAAVTLDDCEGMVNSSNHVHSIAKWAQDEGKATGLVTTTTVTHASPAGVYAHTAQRNWEGDSDMGTASSDTCHDIAYQLVNGETGKKLQVVMGGGREKFLPSDVTDGERKDGRNLAQQWVQDREAEGNNAVYITTRNELLNLSSNTNRVLGLFDKSHMQYNLDRDKTLEPSLEEMTEAAINLLSKQPNGYFLFVEGGKIDHGHHEGKAHKALDETIEFSKAIQKAVDITDIEDTLIVVTSDHAHTMSYSGYPDRANDIFGIGGTDKDGLPYTTLNYANGQGYKPNNADGSRHDVSQDDLTDINYMYSAVFPMASETHGGDDVGIFARGPSAHYFSGVMEENVIPHLMAYSSCVGSGITICDEYKLSKK